MNVPHNSLANLLVNAEVFVDGDWVESKDQDQNGDVRLIQLADVGDGYYIDKSRRFLTSETAKRLKCTYLKPGDILVARMPDPIGRACIYPGDSKPAVTVVDVCIIRVNESEICSRWLMHTLNSPFVRTQISAFATGTTRSRISRGNLAKISLSIPSLSEQRRIADILDKADALRTKRREALAQLDRLAQSIFVEMFGDPALNPKGWPLRPLKEIGKVSTGGTPPSAMEGMFGGDIPFVTPGDLETNQVARRTVTEAGASETGTVRAGAALVCCIGATIGKMAKATVRSSFNQQLNAVDWFSDVMNDDYGLAALRFFKPTIVAWGASTTLPILKKSSFEKIAIPVPPLLLQQEFARRLISVFQLAENISKASELESILFASLQDRAFRGEL